MKLIYIVSKATKVCKADLCITYLPSFLYETSVFQYVDLDMAVVQAELVP